MRRVFLFFLLTSSVVGEMPSLENTAEVTLDLRSPTYQYGILFTEEGGVIRTKDLRVQAQSIQYIKRTDETPPIHRLEAEGNLLILYKGRVYVGSELEYNFITHTGTVYDGKTSSPFWYIGGDEIHLHADGSYKVTNAFFTTCENIHSSWDIHAKRVSVIKDELLQAQKVRFRMFKIPTFWIPSFKLNLKKFKEPILRYVLNWDKGQGPRAMVRYQFYSWRNLELYGRLEYRWKTGWGGAFESEYVSPKKRTSFVTRSYIGTNKLETATNKQFRYRLQGALHSTSKSEKTKTTLTWDKYGDVRMPSDFRSDDFEVNTAQRTLFYVHHQEKEALFFLKVRPRVNSFESIKQDLPTFYCQLRPDSFGKSGIFYNFSAKASYLNFAYSDHLSKNIQGFHTPRLEIRPLLFYPFSIGNMKFTPTLGGVGLFYGTSPSHAPKTLGSVLYGGTLSMQGNKNYVRYLHVLQPYGSYFALTSPSVSPDHHYIFSIQDGYDKINQLQLGLKSQIYSKKRKSAQSSWTADFFANAFFKDAAIPQLIPKLYLSLLWQVPSLDFSWLNAWNFQNKVLDFSNARMRWTASEDLAISAEIRYRSPYDWRKSDHENFILDVSRKEEELLLSPLSDQRLTLLFSLFARLNPFWECKVQSHHGFLRKNQKPYNEIKVDLFTWISSSWKLRLSYSHTQRDDRVSAGLELIKK